MRKFLGTIVIVSAMFAVVGVFRGWYRASADNQSERVSIEIEISKENVKHDFVAVTSKIGAMISGDD